MKKIIDFIIKEKRILNADMFLLVLYSPELPHIKAGQFVNVKVDGEPSTFLRRPISVHNVDEDKGLLYLLIKIAGKGTMQLSKLQKGEKLNIILPLGNGFTAPVGLQDEYEKYAKVYYTTEDGTYGEQGYPTQHSILNEHFDHIYCCGPLPMMKAVAQYAYSHHVYCEVSLENTMACGIGACLCCVNDTKEGHKCVCTDGPIFNINDLKWQN